MDHSESVGPMDLGAGQGQLRVDIDRRDAPVVALYGEIDIATIGVLRDALSSVRTSPGSLTIDLSGVTFIGSCGLTLLLQAHLEAERDGRRIALTRAAPCVEHLLEITGYEQRLHWA